MPGMLSADFLAIIRQALNSQTPLAWGVVIILALVMAEFVKQLIGPMFRKSQARHSDQLLERMAVVLESNGKMLQTLVHQTKFNEKTLERIEGKMP